jgi:hypothetical protein
VRQSFVRQRRIPILVRRRNAASLICRCNGVQFTPEGGDPGKVGETSTTRMNYLFSWPDPVHIALLQVMLDARGIGFEVRNQTASQGQVGLPVMTEL